MFLSNILDKTAVFLSNILDKMMIFLLYTLHAPCECLCCALGFGAEVSAFVPAQGDGGGRELLAEQSVLCTDAVADALHALVAAMLLAVAEGEMNCAAAQFRVLSNEF